MAQDSTFQTPNDLFPATRTKNNSIFKAVQTKSSGSSAPSSTDQFMDWVDTSTSPPTWRMRNTANGAWFVVGQMDTTNLGLATLASPTLTGTPAAPTASASTNTTQIATTAFVQSAIAVVPGWTNATFVNSWVNFGSPFTVTRYRKYPNGDVVIQGVVQKTTSNAANETIFTLPAGSRPGDNLGIVCNAGLGSSSTFSAQTVTISSTTGAVQIVATNTAPNYVNYLQIFVIFKGEN